VTDTGPASRGEQRKRVFERFYRGDPSRHRDSDTSGLAWPSPAHWSPAHGGQSGSTAPLAKAHTFSFTLPIATDIDVTD
jgi:signal transduction histidine kinase